jgi:hypothetical protein
MPCALVQFIGVDVSSPRVHSFDFFEGEQWTRHRVT